MDAQGLTHTQLMLVHSAGLPAKSDQLWQVQNAPIPPPPPTHTHTHTPRLRRRGRARSRSASSSPPSSCSCPSWWAGRSTPRHWACCRCRCGVAGVDGVRTGTYVCACHMRSWWAPWAGGLEGWRAGWRAGRSIDASARSAPTQQPLTSAATNVPSY